MSEERRDSRPEHFFTPRRPTSARLVGTAAMEAMAWHSRITAEPSSFAMSIDLVVFDMMAIVRTTLSPSLVARTSEHVSTLPLGNILYFLANGRVTFTHASDSVLMESRSAVVVPGDSPFEYRVEQPAQLIALVLRRSPDGDSVTGPSGQLHALPDTPFVRALTAFVTELAAGLPHPTSPTGVAIQQALIALVAGALAADDAPPPHRHDTQFAHALAFIAANSSNAALSTSDVAAATGVSVRHLQRVLGRVNASVAGELRRARLRTASNLLLHHDRDGLSIEDVARLSGFGNLERMRRAFVHAVGLTPTEYRSTGSTRLAAGLAR